MSAAPEKPYREVTVATLVIGVVLGVVLTASMTYAGLVIGFVVPTSAIAAILGWGLLKGVLRRGTIIENNINQTVASGVVTCAAGVIFTVPALFLLPDVRFDIWAIGAAAVSGALLGNLYIIPLRTQMIDLERMRFPMGVAVAEVLRAPGAQFRKSALLAIATLVSFVIGLLVSFKVVPSSIDLGRPLGLPAYVPNVWALSLLSIGAGFLSGRAGLVVLVGGVLANWVLAPLVVSLDWVSAAAATQPAQAETALAALVYGKVSRPLGIGFLIGGALAGVALALPMMRAAFASLRSGRMGSEEMDVRWMYGGLGASLLLLGVSAYLGDPSVSLLRVVATAVVGTLWMWLAGVIVAQCAGLTGWSPVSGMALLAVAGVLVITGGSIGLSVLIGAAVCVAVSMASDMMGDLKTGHLIGAKPSAQQLSQLLTSWIGPGIAIVTVYLIWSTVKFGPENPAIPAPQAVTLQGMIGAVQGGDVPLDKYLVGGLVSAILTLATGGGIGVLIGLSMYLPMFYVLPYGLGCVLAMLSDRFLGRSWSGDTGIPLAAGLLVGDSLAGVAFSVYMLAQNVPT